MRWVNETFPPRPRARWLLITMRLSASSLAGMDRTLVAVGTVRLAAMFSAVRAAAPRSRTTWPGSGAAAAAGAGPGLLSGAGCAGAAGRAAVVACAAPAGAGRPGAATAGAAPVGAAPGGADPAGWGGGDAAAAPGPEASVPAPRGGRP